jgi:hypothetical protein
MSNQQTHGKDMDGAKYSSAIIKLHSEAEARAGDLLAETQDSAYAEGWNDCELIKDAEIKALRETLRTAREAGEQLLRPDGSADVWHSAKREIEKVLGGEK